MPALPAWLEPFSPAFREALLPALATPGAGRLACFDADGTLWNEDLGEALFRFLAAGDQLPWLGHVDDAHALWEDYEARVAKNRSEAYGWAVQCMAGWKEAELVRLCRQLAASWPNYRPAMAGLVRGLRAAGWDVWLVSASNHWIIEAGAAPMGADPKQVLAMRVETSGGLLTDRLIRPLTCNQGKVEAIAERCGRAPDLAVGDSLGDLEMLSAARLPLVVGRHDKAGAELLKIAAERRWATHLF